MEGLPRNDRSIRVINITKVSASPQNLSIYDQFLASSPPIKALLFFPTDPLDFPSIVVKLKNSLSKALMHFYPLTGRLAWSPDSNKFEITHDIIGQSSTTFIEAECDEDFSLLVNSDVHNVRVYSELVPDLGVEDGGGAIEVVSVQVTGFRGGGLAIGVSMHHVVVDGRAYWNFVKSWAEICRTGRESVVVPLLDRSAVREPDELTRLYLKSSRSSSTTRKSEPNKSPLSQAPPLSRKTFQLKQSFIQALKDRATQSPKVSSFVAVCAHAWVCSTKARRVPHHEKIIFSFMVDCRSLLRPPLPENYFGNLITPYFIEIEASELLSENGLTFATMTIQTAVWRALKDPLEDCNAWPVWLAKTRDPSRAIVNVCSSPKFRSYETDFGWGKPERIEFLMRDTAGTFVLVDARDEVGGLQVCMVLPPSQMEEFSGLFMNGF
ncbi:Malonyl-CoA:anthocyanidin 5-O-glucoside-6''-O-malonyltransferase [Acorus gramineus]|uniref:Malonyl-CoA:anthocyanidin 5-O-glucoside-6''-O-malonyltransferase n=1 Tax=Acorus gramineus TaxID=55184 RepID=A0AAV9APB3_ACOGR|nr:Malonyl-CoA:anthocyanidin 5-O-glucoside-6''-O-malonyltransferase [Acorus gramineus]